MKIRDDHFANVTKSLVNNYNEQVVYDEREEEQEEEDDDKTLSNHFSSQLADKDIVFTIGANSSGKSTLLNALIQGSENMVRQTVESVEVVEAKMPLWANNEPVFIIMHDKKGNQKDTPDIYMENNIHFVDCPRQEQRNKMIWGNSDDDRLI